MNDVTRILQSIDEGEARAAEELLPLVYEELRRLAALKMAGEPPGQTLQPTALVHEAWLRLVGEGHAWANRRLFFSAAAEAMRRILIERARRRMRQKHGGEIKKVSLDDVAAVDLAVTTEDEVLVLLDDALRRLAATDPVGAELVRLRFFAGLPNVQAAELLGLSERTAKRTWAYARAWLYEEIKKATNGSPQ